MVERQEKCLPQIVSLVQEGMKIVILIDSNLLTMKACLLSNNKPHLITMDKNYLILKEGILGGGLATL